MLNWSVRKDVSRSVQNLSARRAPCDNGKTECRAKVCGAGRLALVEAENRRSDPRPRSAE